MLTVHRLAGDGVPDLPLRRSIVHRWPLTAALLAALLLSGCAADAPTGISPSEQPIFSITGGQEGGNPYFQWLSPMVSGAKAKGQENTSLSPRLEICEWSGVGEWNSASCALEAWFTDGGSHPAGAPRLETNGKHYQANWSTRLFETDPAKQYRARVLLGEKELGHADFVVARNGKEARGATTDEIVGLVAGQTIPLKFVVFAGASCWPDADCEASADAGDLIEVQVGVGGGTFEMPSGNAAVTFPPGAVTEDVTLTVFSRDLENPQDCMPTTIRQFSGCYLFSTLPKIDQFEAPVKIEIRFDPAEVNDLEGLAILHFDPEDTGSGVTLLDRVDATILESTNFSDGGRVAIAGLTTSFSHFVTGQAQPGGSTVDGTVRYSTTALAGVTVELVQGSPTDPPLHSTLTDAAGQFSFTSVADGDYILKVYGPTAEYIEWMATTISVAAVDLTQDFALAKVITLVSPADRTTTTDLQPTLTWQANPDAATYGLQLNITDPWTVVEDPQDLSATSYDVQTPLTPGVNYTWGVEAFDAFGNSVGVTELAFSFTVVEAGALYALSWSGSQEEFVRVDVETGSRTTLSVLPVQSISMNTSTLDWQGGRYFFVGSNGSGEQRYAVNVTDGTYSTVGTPQGVNEIGHEYDSASASLYALSSNGVEQEFVQIDPTTGARTVVAVLPVDAISGGTSTLNSQAGRFYFLGTADGVTERYSVELATGAFTTFGVPTGVNEVEHEYDSATGAIYALSWSGTEEHFVRINPATGARTLVTVLPVESVSGGSSTLDAQSGKYYFVGTESGVTQRYSVDLGTGAVATLGATEGINELEHEFGPLAQ